MGSPQLPQRPIPPVHHVWVAGPGDARRLFRSTLARTPGLLRLGITWAILLALIIVSVILDPTHNLAWLIVALSFPILLAILVWRQTRSREKLMVPGSVWATGFGANELLIITPMSTVVIDYAALRPPRVSGPAVLIQNRRSAGSTVLPHELVPPEALTFLQQRIGP